MFEPTWTWPNFTFGQLCMWIGANYDQIWFPMDQTCESGWTYSNFLCEMRQIMNSRDYTSDSEQCSYQLDVII